MTDTIEPTEEQRMAAARYYYREDADTGRLVGHVADWVKTGDGVDDVDSDVVDFARLLAEREHKLREYVGQLEDGAAGQQDLVDQLRADLDAARANVGMLEVAVRDARARIAELEAKIKDACFSCPGCGRHDFGLYAADIKAACGPCREREAAHLAHIKALRGFVDDEAERDCSYGDGCPDFSGSRHGTCTGCKARKVLARCGVTHDPIESREHDCLSPAPCPTCGPFTDVEGGEG